MKKDNDPLSLPDGQPTRVRWLVFGLACGTSWLLYVHRYSWGVIKKSLKTDYADLTDVHLGWIDSGFMASYALGQVPAGLAGDVLGPRLVLALIILTWSLLVGWLGLSSSYLALFVGMTLLGLAQAGAYPNLGKVTRSWFPLSIRTSVQGAVASLSGRAGGACSGLIVATLLMGLLHLTWRTSLFVLAGLGVGFALAFWVLFRDRPGEHPWANAAEQQLVDEGIPLPAPGTRPRLRRDELSLFNLAMLLLLAFASTFVDTLYVFWIPLFLLEAKGLSPQAMGIYGSLPMFGGALGGLCGGFLNDLMMRRLGRRFTRSAIGFTGKIAAATLLALSVLVDDGREVMVVLLVCKFFTDTNQPTIWGTITDISGRAAGTIFGLVNGTGSVAAMLAGPVIGYVKYHYGWDVVFFVLAGLYVIAAFSWLLIDCTRTVVEDAPIDFFQAGGHAGV